MTKAWRAGRGTGRRAARCPCPCARVPVCPAAQHKADEIPAPRRHFAPRSPAARPIASAIEARNLERRSAAFSPPLCRQRFRRRPSGKARYQSAIPNRFPTRSSAGADFAAPRLPGGGTERCPPPAALPTPARRARARLSPFLMTVWSGMLMPGSSTCCNTTRGGGQRARREPRAVPQPRAPHPSLRPSFPPSLPPLPAAGEAQRSGRSRAHGAAPTGRAVHPRAGSPHCAPADGVRSQRAEEAKRNSGSFPPHPPPHPHPRPESERSDRRYNAWLCLQINTSAAEIEGFATVTKRRHYHLKNYYFLL